MSVQESFVAPDPATARVKLPTLHAAQAKLRWLMTKARFVAARCGRRFGKNVLGESIAADDASHGRLVGWFAPENKRLAASFEVIAEYVDPVKKRSSKNEGIIRTINGGSIEFWSLEDPDAGRSRKYHRIIVDEAAFTKQKTIDWWMKAARPTLVDYRGRALIMSNTNGIDPDNFLYEICHNPKHGFVQYHAPSHSNPHLPRDEVEAFAKDFPLLVYQQEFLAEFVDWSGAAFFALNSMLVNGNPVTPPARCEAVFVTIDTATKTGKKHDGTAAIYWAIVRNNFLRPVATATPGAPTTFSRYSLVVLDWDISQIEGAMLETWLPTVNQRLKEWSATCKASRGALPAMIEDKASGMILLQQAARRGIPAMAIDSKLTAVGKDERAISVSGYVHRGLVKMSEHAFTKTVNYKGNTQNHMRLQVTGFRIGDKDSTREDDLLDAFTYGVAIVLGNSEGF